VPNVMVRDGVKDLVQGDFRRKSHDAGCNIKHTDPYNDKSNQGEDGVRELKRGVG
jgi:hypothetical protein